MILIPKVGDATRPLKPRSNEEEEVDMSIENFFNFADAIRKHYRQLIVNVGREEVPTPLQQFTELINAAKTLADIARSTQEGSITNTMLALQIIGRLMSIPAFSEKIGQILNMVFGNPVKLPTLQQNPQKQ